MDSKIRLNNPVTFQNVPIAVNEYVQCSVFADESPPGNQTAIYRLKEWPADEVLRRITRLSQIHEKTFIIVSEDRLEMRWFLNEEEVPLCGHAAVAVAHLFSRNLSHDQPFVVPNVRTVLKLVPEAIILPPARLEKVAHNFTRSGLAIKEAYATERDYLFVLESWDALRQYRADSRLQSLNRIGCILTSRHPVCDVAMRFFVPGNNLYEDPASASIIPALQSYWEQQGTVRTFFQGTETGVTIQSRHVGNDIQVGGTVKWLGKGTFFPGFLP